VPFWNISTHSIDRVRIASKLDLLLARDLHYLPETNYDRLKNELLIVRKMLTALLQNIGADRMAANM